MVDHTSLPVETKHCQGVNSQLGMAVERSEEGGSIFGKMLDKEYAL